MKDVEAEVEVEVEEATELGLDEKGGDGEKVEGPVVVS